MPWQPLPPVPGAVTIELDLQPETLDLTPDLLDLQPDEPSIGERAVNAAVALPQGLATSVGDSIAGAARTVDTVRSGALLTMDAPGTAQPTTRQRRRAFERSMDDPRYMAALIEAGDDPAKLDKAESLFGPNAKLETYRAPIEAEREIAAGEGLAQQQRLEENPVYQFGRDYSEAARRDVYPTNPYLDTKFESKLTRAVGSTVPSVALGFVPGVGLPAAVAQYGASQAEQMAQEAIDAGRPELAMQAAAAGLFIGAVSEATIGASARLKSLLRQPTRIAALESWAAANPIKAATIIASVREAAQEGTEQAMQNATASDLVGYDPGRPWHQQVIESMVLGGLAGGIFGGGAAVMLRQPAGAGAPASVTPTPNEPTDEAEALDAVTRSAAALQAPSTDLLSATGERQPVQPSREINLAEARGEAPGAAPAAPERLTPEQRMAREATAAMAELRRMKAAAEQRQRQPAAETAAEQPAPAAAAPSSPEAPPITSDAEGLLKMLDLGRITLENPSNAVLRRMAKLAEDNQIPSGLPPQEIVAQLRQRQAAAQAAAPAPEPPPPAAEPWSSPYLEQLRATNRAREAELAGTNPLPPTASIAPASPEAPTVPVQPSEPAPPPGPARRRRQVPPREDGVPDILDAIQQLGGIRPPGSQAGTGEYDGYGAFNQGVARLLRGGSERPDVLLQALQQQGFGLTTPDELYDAVRSAVRSRAALTEQLQAGRVVRPARVAAVERLYEQAVGAGEAPAVTLEQVDALDATLNPRERKALRAQLETLRQMATTPDERAQPTEIQQAVQRVKDAYWDLGTMGAIYNPEVEARKQFEFYRALYALARVLIRRGVRSLQEFAARARQPVTPLLEKAWADANAGTPLVSPHQMDPLDVADLAAALQPRKFSERFQEDARLAPLLRGRTGNGQYQPMPNVLTAAEALAVVDERGIDGAIVEMMDERNDLEPRVRVTLGQAIIHKLNVGIPGAVAATQNALADKAADVADYLTELGTRLGQGVQAFKIWDRMTPEGFVGAYRRQVRRTAEAQRRAGVPELRLPQVDPAIARDVAARAREALRQPAGFQRDEAIVSLLNYIARRTGLPHWELLSSLWYANILSGWTTQLRNVAGNLTNLFAETAAHAAVRPQFVPSMLAGLFRGFYRGAIEGTRVLRTGTVTGARLTRLEALGSLELAQFGRRGGVTLGPGRLPRALTWLAESRPAYALNAWKYVFRVMAAADMTFFRSAQEMRARWAAREIARREGLSGQALSRRLADLLHHAPELRRQAETQAQREGLTGLRRRQRVEELLEQARPAALIQESSAFGRFATFNQDPQGVLGSIARHIAEWTAQYPVGRFVVPFTRIVANVFNNALNYTPWGYARLFSRHWMGADAAPTDYQLQAARSTLGLLGLSAVYALARAYDDDDDPYFAITAQGPQDIRTRNQLRETGWQPYSVKFGTRWFQYQITPAAPGLAYLGALQDARRYRGLEDAPALNRAAYALQAIGPALLSQSFVNGLADFLDDLKDDRVSKTGTPGKFLRRTAGTVIPNLVKQIDRVFDPTVYDDATIQAALLRDIPIARRGLKPMLNVLGEPIRPDLNPFLNLDRQDPLWSTIVQKQAWISEPSKLTMVFNRPIDPDEYYDWIADSGPQIRRRLEVLLPYLQAVPAELAQDRVQTIVREERAKSRKRLGLGGR